jgi:hypothetical protein
MKNPMRRASIGLAGAVVALWSLAASADPILDDPLHAFCWGTSTCSDNGTVTPTTSNPPQFGFSISPGPQTGDFVVDILLPNNYALPAGYSITGTQGGAANNSALSATATLIGTWTSGALGDFLGIPKAEVSPTNPLDNWLSYTQAHGDAGASGYYVFQADLGTNQLMLNPDELNGPLLNIGSSLGVGTVITGFLNTGTVDVPNWVATASSGGLFIGGGGSTPPTSVPEPGALALFAAGLGAMAFVYRRKMLTARIDRNC